MLKRVGSFVSPEHEFSRLHEWVGPGDWVLDIGANVGHYTERLADLVGLEGRVIAIEPVSSTFELLAANLSGRSNVTLLNVAASSTIRSVEMSVPDYRAGLKNFYRAKLGPEASTFSVLSIPVDALNLPRVSLIKLDVEGHELEALEGMRGIIEKYKPRLIVEGRSAEVADWLSGFGYEYCEREGSPNRIYEARNGI